MVAVDAIVRDRAGGVADVEAGDAAGGEDASDLVPDVVEDAVHGFVCALSVTCVEGVADRGVALTKEVVPHLDHRVGRGRDDEVDGVVVEGGEVPRVGGDDAVGGLHGIAWQFREINGSVASSPTRAGFGLLPVEDADDVAEEPEDEQVGDDDDDDDESAERGERAVVEHRVRGGRVARSEDDPGSGDGEPGEPEQTAEGADDGERGVSEPVEEPGEATLRGVSRHTGA